MTENTKWCFIKEKMNGKDKNYFISRIVEKKDGLIKLENFTVYEKSLIRHSDFETVTEDNIVMWEGFTEPLDMTLEISKTILLQDKPVDEVKIILRKVPENDTKLVLMTFEYGYVIIEVHEEKVVGTVCCGITLVDVLNKYFLYMEQYNKIMAEENSKSESDKSEE